MKTPSEKVLSLFSKRRLPQGFTTSFVVHDHLGFNADVSCSSELIGPGPPHLNIINQKIDIPKLTTNSPANKTLWTYEFSRVCGNTTHWGGKLTPHNEHH